MPPPKKVESHHLNEETEGCHTKAGIMNGRHNNYMKSRMTRYIIKNWKLGSDRWQQLIKTTIFIHTGI